MGRYDEALGLYLKIKSIDEKVLGPEHPVIASTLNNLALLYSRMGEYKKALPLYTEAKNLREKKTREKTIPNIWFRSIILEMFIVVWGSI